MPTPKGIAAKYAPRALVKIYDAYRDIEKYLERFPEQEPEQEDGPHDPTQPPERDAPDESSDGGGDDDDDSCGAIPDKATALSIAEHAMFGYSSETGGIREFPFLGEADKDDPYALRDYVCNVGRTIPPESRDDDAKLFPDRLVGAVTIYNPRAPKKGTVMIQERGQTFEQLVENARKYRG